MKRFYLIGGIVALLFAAVAGAAAYDTYFHGRVVVGLSSTYAPVTCTAAVGDGELCVSGDIESNGNLDIAGTITSGGAFAQSGDLTLSGGAGALTFSGTASSVLMDDNDTTALLFGSTGQLGLLTLDTGDATETVEINGTTTATAFHVNVGTAQFDETVTITGDLTCNGGAGALDFSGSGDSSIKVADGDATALLVFDADDAAILTVDTTEGAESITTTGQLKSATLVSTTLEANLAAGACTAGSWFVDNQTTRELCRCNDGGTAYDCVSVTTANGPTD